VSSKIERSNLLNVLLAVMFATVIALFAVESYADAVTDTLCNAISFVQGGVGKAVAIIVIISVAIMMFLGKITWGVAIAVAVGMGLLFGAQSVVEAISPGGQATCVNATPAAGN